jgi:hypothetical protein
MRTEVLAKIHASGKSMILAILCQNLQADSVGGGESILEQVGEPSLKTKVAKRAILRWRRLLQVPQLKEKGMIYGYT